MCVSLCLFLRLIGLSMITPIIIVSLLEKSFTQRNVHIHFVVSVFILVSTKKSSDLLFSPLVSFLFEYLECYKFNLFTHTHTCIYTGTPLSHFVLAG